MLYRFLNCDILASYNFGSPSAKNEKANLEVALPQGVWQRFHFDDDNPVMFNG